MDKCRTIFGGWRCNFEPRYDLAEPHGVNYEGSTTSEGLARIINASRAETYVCDVCTACGETRQRSPK